MEFFKVKTFDEVKKTILNEIGTISKEAEVVPLRLSSARRSVEEIISKENLPEYNRSTVDGYAVKAASTYGASDSIPSMLKVIGRVTMGAVGEFSIGAGQAVYVPTGGAVPKGADAMVMLEYTQAFGEDIAVYKPASVRDNIIGIGEDVKIGDVILRKGEVVTSLKTGVLAALGVDSVKVLKPLRVAVISTGDEIVDICEKTQIGQIRDVNTQINVEFCQKNGFEVSYTARVKDGFEMLNNAVSTALDKADIVLVSGGSSIGARDYTEQVFSTNGEILVHGIALKPGKPTLIARGKSGGLLIGLPGHPMACLLVLKLLVIDAVNTALGGGEDIPFVYASATTNFPSSPGRLTVQPVVLSYKADGVTATPIFYKSGFVSVMDKADGYILIPENTEGIQKDERVKTYLLR